MSDNTTFNSMSSKIVESTVKRIHFSLNEETYKLPGEICLNTYGSVSQQEM
jgi:hypothetical protein